MGSEERPNLIWDVDRSKHRWSEREDAGSWVALLVLATGLEAEFEHSFESEVVEALGHGKRRLWG